MQLLQALFFYLIFSLFALIGLPLISRLIANKTLAYIAAKPFGLILFGYFIWVLSSFHWLNYQNHWLILALYLAAIATGGFFSRVFFCLPAGKKNEPRPTAVLKKILIVEAATLAAFLGYLYLRSFNPAINGTERFMDLALLSAAGKTNFFPFIDPWFAGKTVNYYYYGSYLMSLLGNLAHLKSVLVYNFALGLIYCQAAILAAGLVWSATRSKLAAVTGAFLLTTAGTLFFAGCTLHAAWAGLGTVCSYASSTRFYSPSYIINEIPSYSFTVGDLHAHLLALPFFLLNLVLLYGLAGKTKPARGFFAALGLGLATSGMINVWDMVTLISVLCVLLLAKIILIWRTHSPKPERLKLVRYWLLGGFATLVLAGILMWPNLIHFQSPVLGLGFIPGFVAAHHLTHVQWPTPLTAQLGMWGILAGGIIWGFWAKRRTLADYLHPLVLSIVSLGIIVGVELFFIEDIYSVANPPYFRANTTFKFGYHAWTMLVLVFTILLFHLLRRASGRKSRTRPIAAFVLLIALVGGLFYPYQAIKQFYLADSAQAKTLDGSSWMQAQMPDDWMTINYINQTLTDRAVIAEAVGDSYTTYSRIATYTGMITPMGWKTHEWTWRFDAKAAKQAPIGADVETGWGQVAAVAGDMATLYETSDLSEAKRIIQQYGIQYIYVGGLERTAYPGLDEAKFGQLGTVVFASGSSKLFRVR